MINGRSQSTTSGDISDTHAYGGRSRTRLQRELGCAVAVIVVLSTIVAGATYVSRNAKNRERFRQTMSDLVLVQERAGLPITPTFEPSPKFSNEGSIVAMHLEYRSKALTDTSIGLATTRDWMVRSHISETAGDLCSIKGTAPALPPGTGFTLEPATVLVELGDDLKSCKPIFSSVWVTVSKPLPR